MEKRATLVEGLKSPHGFWHLVVSPCSSTYTYVITIDATTGTPLYAGIPSIDMFNDHSFAVEYVTANFNSQSMFKGEGIVGMTIQHKLATIIVVDGSTVAGYLPTGDLIRTIDHTKCIQIPLGGKKPEKNPVMEFQLSKNHYFCDTYDLTRPFPSEYKPYEPDPAFVWNSGLIRPFEELGLRNCCITMLQGVAATYSYNADFTLTHILRRASFNPGTRYAARGLNQKGWPGNEVEAELIFSRNGNFNTVRWRRGSIPIRWKTVLNSSVSAPQHKLDDDYFQGTPEYFKGLQERYNTELVRCISLLHTKEGHSESEICGGFKEAISKLEGAGVNGVSYIPFDLNHFLKEGSLACMNAILPIIRPLAEHDGFTTGKLPGTVETSQSGILRFNCADSLDRTNLATFYFAMLMTADYCRSEKVGLNDANAPTPNLVIKQPIIDFLARTFVESGNVVSTMYTDTLAIKVNAIREFSPVLEAQNDTAITVKRRIVNVVGDPARQKIIEGWVFPPELEWNHRISPSYLRVIEGPQALVGIDVQLFKFDAAHCDVVIALPLPMQLTAFVMFMAPGRLSPSSVMVMGGATPQDMSVIADLALPMTESPTWTMFKVGQPERWGLDPAEPSFIRFVRFRFFARDDSYVIGNIKLEARSNPGRVSKRGVLPPPPAPPSAAEDFKPIFEQFARRQTMVNALMLEQKRIYLNLPEEVRSNLAQQSGISPWFADSHSRIVAAPSALCCFCGRPFVEDEVSYKLYQSALFPGLLVNTKAPGAKSVHLCRSCQEDSNLFDDDTAKHLAEDLVVDLPLPPHYEVLRAEPPKHDRDANISAGLQCIVAEATSGLEKALRGNAEFELNGEAKLSLVFFFPCIISNVVVEGDLGEDFELLMGADRKPMKRSGSVFESASYDFASGLDLTFKSKSSRIVSVVVYGYRGKDAELGEATYDGAVPVSLKDIPRTPFDLGPAAVTTFDRRTRIDSVNFGSKAVRREVTFEVAGQAGTPLALSVILSLHADGEAVWSRHIILPSAAPGTRLKYPIDYMGEADAAKLSYIDRTADLIPHVVHFK